MNLYDIFSYTCYRLIGYIECCYTYCQLKRDSLRIAAYIGNVNYISSNSWTAWIHQPRKIDSIQESYPLISHAALLSSFLESFLPSLAFDPGGEPLVGLIFTRYLSMTMLPLKVQQFLVALLPNSYLILPTEPQLI